MGIGGGTYEDQYHRNGNDPVGPVAVATGAVAASLADLMFGTNANGAIVTLTLAATYQYLVVAYDGPNGGVIVYNIASLAVGTVIELARYAQPDPPVDGVGPRLLRQDVGQYQMTGWTLLNPTQQQVPDGGSAIALLGIAMVGIEGLRRKLRS
jgi:hypothetical protein